MNPDKPMEVVVTDVSMSFWPMVVFMVKWVIAAIPAFLILMVIGAVLSGLFGGLFMMGRHPF